MVECKQRMHVIVHGLVQGVGYRDFARKQAQALKLTGWVRNLINGEVEITVEGPIEKLQALVDELKKGPYTADVTKVITNFSTCEDQWTDFRVIH